MTRTEVTALNGTRQVDRAGREFIVTSVKADYGTAFAPSSRWTLRGRTVDTDAFAFSFVPREGN